MHYQACVLGPLAVCFTSARVLQARPSELRGTQIEFGAGGRKEIRGKLNNAICM